MVMVLIGLDLMRDLNAIGCQENRGPYRVLRSRDLADQKIPQDRDYASIMFNA